MITVIPHDDPPYTLEHLIALNHELAQLIARAQGAHQRQRDLHTQAQMLNERMRNTLQIPSPQKLKQITANR